MPLDQRFVQHFKLLAKRESKFKQEKATKYFNASVTEHIQADVSGGFCRGACLHWLRISINKDSDAVISHKNTELVSRMAVTQSALDVTRDGAFAEFEEHIRRKEKDLYDQAFRQKGAEMLLPFQKWLDELQCDYEFDLKPPPATHGIFVLPRKKMSPDILQIIEDRVKAALKDVPAQSCEYAEEQAKRITDKFDRIAQGRSGVQTKKLWRYIAPKYPVGAMEPRFETILPVLAYDGSSSDRISSFVCSAIAQPSFTPGRGLLVGFACPAESTTTMLPHAIALLKSQTCEEYLLFDPNLGVYRLSNLSNAIGAVVLLLVDGYDKRAVNDDDDWLLFAKTKQEVPFALADDSGLLNKARGERDKAIANLKGHFDNEAKKAYEVVSAYLEASTKSNVAVKKRYEEMVAAYERTPAGEDKNRALSEIQKLGKSYNAALEEKKALIEKLNGACVSIRTGLTPGSDSDLKIDENALERFTRANGQLSATGLAGLYEFLNDRP